MALADELTARLDAGSLVSTFIGALGQHGDALGAVGAPDISDGEGAIAATLSSFDPQALAPSIAQLVQQGTQGLAGIAPVAQPLAALQDALALVELATEGNLGQQVSDLLTQLRAVLQGEREGGLMGTLLRLSELLSGSAGRGPLGPLVSLLQRALSGAGVGLPAGVSDAAGLLPAVDGMVRALGGLMALETVLAEAQRLFGVMADQLDAATLQQRSQALLQALDATLVQRMDTADPSDAAAVDACVGELDAATTLLRGWLDDLAAGMGLGQATLVHLNMTRVQADVATAGALLRDVHLDVLARQLQAALGGLRPLMGLDFAAAPANALDQLLSQAEAQVAGLVGRLQAWDPVELVQPLQQGLQTLTAPLAQVHRLTDEALTTVQAGLAAVRQVVQALSLDSLADAINTVLRPVTDALALITQLVADVSAALHTAAQAATQALGDTEAAVDGFKAQLQTLFGQARAFIDDLHLENLAGTLNDRVADFTRLLSQAELKPYFDTAVDAIGAASDVVDAVPFDLLPDSMKADVDAAVAPIKATDLSAFETQVEAAVGIGPDGELLVRQDLEDALAALQAKFDALVAALRSLDPQQHLQALDEQLAALAEQVRQIAPAVTLQPVQDLIDQAKAAVAGLDLEGLIAPLQQVFDDAEQALQAWSPAALITPLQQRVDSARTAVTDALHLDRWTPALDLVHEQAQRALDLVNPAQLQDQLAALLAQARGLAAALPDINPQWLGSLVAGLHRGSSLRLSPLAFGAVQGWLARGGALDALGARTTAIADAVARTQAAVAALDLAALGGTMQAPLQAVAVAAQRLADRLPADAPQRDALASLQPRLDVQAALSRLTVLRAGYQAMLEAALPLGETLRRTGLSEVDHALTQLRGAFEPVRSLLDGLTSFLRAAGVPQAGASVPRMVQALFDVAPPERVAGLAAPIFVAMRDRVLALLDSVLQPLKDAVAELTGLIADFDLGPLKQAVDDIFQAALAQLHALSPAGLLAAPLASVATLKQQVAQFDPLAALLGLLDALRDTAARLIGKLSASQLLADPVAIYNEIVDAIDQLNVQALMQPVLDLLARIAHDVDSGLDDTVTAFKRLQDALPAGGGGSSVSVEVTA